MQKRPHITLKIKIPISVRNFQRKKWFRRLKFSQNSISNERQRLCNPTPTCCSLEESISTRVSAAGIDVRAATLAHCSTVYRYRIEDMSVKITNVNQIFKHEDTGKKMPLLIFDCTPVWRKHTSQVQQVCKIWREIFFLTVMQSEYNILARFPRSDRNHRPVHRGFN